jgi:tetratricopeptide (TPR) repeat protein
MSVNYQVYSETSDYVTAPHSEAESLLEKGIEALTKGDILSALNQFEKAFHINNSPLISSYYAFCIAKERRQFSKAIALCEEAIKKDPQNPFHYLNLGRIHLLSNEKADALKIFREGLKYGVTPQVADATVKLVTPDPPVMPLLKKENQFNKYLCLMLKKLGLS